MITSSNSTSCLVVGRKAADEISAEEILAAPAPARHSSTEGRFSIIDERCKSSDSDSDSDPPQPPISFIPNFSKSVDYTLGRGMTASVSASRFRIVPLENHYKRGRWMCWDYYDKGCLAKNAKLPIPVPALQIPFKAVDVNNLSVRSLNDVVPTRAPVRSTGRTPQVTFAFNLSSDSEAEGDKGTGLKTREGIGKSMKTSHGKKEGDETSRVRSHGLSKKEGDETSRVSSHGLSKKEGDETSRVSSHGLSKKEGDETSRVITDMVYSGILKGVSDRGILSSTTSSNASTAENQTDEPRSGLHSSQLWSALQAGQRIEGIAAGGGRLTPTEMLQSGLENTLKGSPKKKRGSSSASSTGLSNSSGNASQMVAIDSKIEQAMDLVKTHLMFAVREEVEVLRGRILELESSVCQLEAENIVLRKHVSEDILNKLNLN